MSGRAERAGVQRRSGLWLAIALASGCAGGGSGAARHADGEAGVQAAGAGSGTSAGVVGGANAGAAAEAAGAGAGGAAGAGVGAAGEPSAGAGGAGPLDAAAILRSRCAHSTVESNLVPANILFVVDRTGTMACNPPPTTDSESCETTPQRANTALPSKWEITSQALIEALSGLPATATVGVSYFSNDESCGVNSMPSVPLALNSMEQRAAIEASLRSVSPGGGTPLVGATILAYRHMHMLALVGSITGNEFVVLISDGEQSEECSYAPRCADAQSCYDLLLDEEVPKAAAPGVGIRTFVIGAPGSEPARTVLSTLAQRGGTGAPGCDPQLGNCHFGGDQRCP
jgi:hypothetical protein